MIMYNNKLSVKIIISVLLGCKIYFVYKTLLVTCSKQKLITLNNLK